MQLSFCLRPQDIDHIHQIELHGLSRYQPPLHDYRTKRGSKGVTKRRIPVIVSSHNGAAPKPDRRRVSRSCLITCSSTETYSAGDTRTKPTKCLLINSRSLRDKTFKLNEFISEFDLDYEFITESWLKSDVSDGAHLSELTPPGFDSLNFPRTSRGGGIAIVHKSTERIQSACHKSFSSFEWQEIRFEANHRSVKVVTVHRPPPSSVNKLTFKGFIVEFAELLDLYASDTSRKVFIGDFNIHVNKADDSEVRQYLELLRIYGLTQLVDKPTHKSRNILDHNICSKDDIIVSSIHVAPEVAISDHYPVFFDLNLDSSVSSGSGKNFVTHRNL